MINQSTAMLHFSATIGAQQGQLTLYRCAINRGRRAQRWSMLAGRSRCLVDLASVRANCFGHACRDAGLQTVSIDRIQGSEGRAGDFDRDFNPLQERTRDRWLHIASAREQGRVLPPVDLVQVGETYFVRDGHHRISVARALGEQAIEARVVIWQVNGLMPCETLARTPRHVFSSRLMGLARSLDKVFGPATFKALLEALPCLAGSETVSEPASQ